MPSPASVYIGGRFTQARVCRRRGVFAAVDLTTNKLAWRQQWRDICYAGSIVTRGGLVFVGRGDGRLTALDKAQRQDAVGVHDRCRESTPQSPRSSTRAAVCRGAVGGSFFPNSKRGDSVWMFSLDGGFVTSGAGAASGSAVGDGETLRH